MNIGAVIVAAGRGERAGQSHEGPKQYRRIGGIPVIRRTLSTFLRHPTIDAVAVAVHSDDFGLFRDAAGDLADRVTIVPGGRTRQESTRLALEALEGRDLGAVLIHDGVRPFVDDALIDRVIAGIDGCGSLPALPVSDTLKRAGDEAIVGGTVGRDDLHAAQTPQAFPFKAILKAHRDAAAAGRSDFTDDAAIAEWAGIPVRIVAGSPDNMKLTWARDIEMADARFGQAASFPDVRTGNGYDVHQFAEGDHVTLCGVAIPHGRRLS